MTRLPRHTPIVGVPCRKVRDAFDWMGERTKSNRHHEQWNFICHNKNPGEKNPHRKQSMESSLVYTLERIRPDLNRTFVTVHSHWKSVWTSAITACYLQQIFLMEPTLSNHKATKVFTFPGRGWGLSHNYCNEQTKLLPNIVTDPFNIPKHTLRLHCILRSSLISFIQLIFKRYSITKNISLHYHSFYSEIDGVFDHSIPVSMLSGYRLTIAIFACFQLVLSHYYGDYFSDMHVGIQSS